MNDNPLISVIIPSYNRARFIERALNSVCAQTYKNLEVIVVDDGSSDDTEERVSAMARMDSRISYVRHFVNRGAQAARNTGVHKAKGVYIALLDSDNEWLPSKIEKQIEVFHNGNHAIGTVYTGFIRKYADGHIGYEQKPCFRGEIIKDALSDWVADTSTLLIKKKVLLAAGVFDERIRAFQEWDLCIRLSMHGEFDYVNERLVIYHLHKYETVSKGVNSADAYMDLVNIHYDDIIRIAGKITLVKHFKIAGNTYMLIPAPQDARNCFKKALKIRPFDCNLLFLYIAAKVGGNFYKAAMSFDYYYSAIFYRKG
jgi:glycosyltransferase involved in cell wall biosynthesis